MAIDVSGIQNNNKFDPVREALLELETLIAETGSAIGNGTITISTSGNLTGSGSFTLNQFGNSTITIGIDDSSYLTSSDISDFLTQTDTDLLYLPLAGGTLTGDLNGTNLILSGYLRGPSTLVIDPAAHGNATGLVQILGDLRVDGTTTIINSTTINVSDKNITIAKDAATAGDANGAGITIAGANATLTYLSVSDDFTFNKVVNASGFVGDLTGNADTADALSIARNIALDGSVLGNADFDGSGNITITTTTNHNHDDRYYTETESDNRFVNVSGDTMTGNLNWGATDQGLTWAMNTDGAYIKFFNTGDGDTDSRLEYATSDNGDEYHRFVISGTERMRITATGITATGYNKTNWDAAYSYSQIGHLPLTGGTLTGDLTLDDKLTITGTNNNFVIDEEADGTWHLYDTFQDNGIVLYSGSGGMDFQYMGVTEMTIDGSGVSFTGTINLDAADLNIGSADIIFGTTAGGATRGLIWDVSGSGFLSKLIGGGADGGKVTLFANMDDAITTGNIFEIKDGSTGSLFLGLSHAGILTAGGGTSTQWNTAYSYSQVGHLPLAGGSLTGNLSLTSSTGTLSVYSSAGGFAAKVFAGWTAGTGISMSYLPNTAESFIDNNYIVTSGEVFGDINFRQNVAGTMTTRMMIKADGGDVGIGKTPTTKLDVNGVITATGGNSTNWNTAYGWGNHANAGYLTSFDITTQTDPKYLRSDESDTMTGSLTINASGVGLNVSSTQNTGLIVDGGTNSGIISEFKYGSTKAVINTSGGGYFLGKIGIGVTSPAARLDIVSTTAGEEGLRVDGATGGFAFVVKGGSDYTSHIRAGATIGANYFTTPPSNGLIVEGYVGIGTTSPTYKLDVYQDADVWHASFGSSTGELRIGGQTSSGAVIQSYVPGTTTTRDLYLQRDGGNLGIGTYSPSYKLDVNGVTRFRNIVRFVTNDWNLSDDGFNRFYFSASGRTYFGSGGGYEWRSAADSSMAVITDAGNMGIGTTNPISGLSTPLTLEDSVNGYVGISLRGTGLYENTWQMYASGDGGSTKFFGLYDRTNGAYRLVATNSGKVGIGTSAPYANLDLGASGENNIILRNTANAYNLGYIGNAGGRISIGFSDSNGSLVALPYLSVLSSGYVGIGTTSPGYTLQIGNTSTNSSAAIIGSATAGIEIRTNSAGGRIAALEQYFSNEGSLWLYLSNTTKVLVRANGDSYFNGGNVGIGTTSPGTKLAINGGNGNQLSLNNSGERFTQIGLLYNGTQNGALWLDSTDATIDLYANTGHGIRLKTGGDNARLTITSTGAATFGGTLTTTDVLYAGSGGTGVTITWGGSLSYIFSPPEKALYLGVSSTISNGIYINTSGRVGIGDTSPDTRLSVYESGDVWHAKIGNDSGQLRIGGQTSSGAVIQSRTQAGGARDLYLQRDGGKVGIGTDVPSFRLDVYENADVWHASFGSSLGELRIGGASGSGATIQSYVPGSTTTRDLYIQRDGGNVGIGKTDPASKLDVAGQIRSTAATGEIYAYSTAGANLATIYAGWTGGTGMMMRYLPNTAEGYIENNYPVTSGTVFGDINFRQNVGGTMTTRMIIKADGGDVGIGTNSPGRRLTVYNTSDIVNGQLRLGYSDSYYWELGRDASVNGRLMFVNKQDNTPSELFSILPNGDVGIGDTSPSYKLDVNGTIRATGDVYAYSDARVKENIQTIDNALDKVMSMRGVSYNRTDNDDKAKKIGVIAQEMQKVLPEVVSEQEDGMLSVSYGNIVGVLIEAIKELKAEIDELKKQK